jgi:signal transduction histidine kinase
VRLEFDSGDQPSGSVATALAVGDGRHVQRAVTNVVRNAIEHAPPGSSVAVDVRRDGGTSTICVSDHGDGIAAAELAHIFDRFYRTDASRSRDRGGSGLGLSIARWALRGMGGDITAESTVGRGTRVTIALPTPRS